MDQIETARKILSEIGMPEKQQSNLCALTLLALCDIKKQDTLANASNNWIRIHDIIQFVNTNYASSYAENSRETFRKQALHHFRNAALIEDNGLATNSPNYRYRLTSEFLSVLKKNGKRGYKKALKDFLTNHESLKNKYKSKKAMPMSPIKINDKDYSLSPGSHNQLQKAILEEFAPRFAPNSECLYLGDTTHKDLVRSVKKMEELGFDITLHDKMPDVVLYRPDKDWLYFIEAVDSVGPMSPERIIDIQRMTQQVKCGKIFVTAFLDFKKYKRFSEQIAWETEVWIAEMPDHMIHLNGDKFLGPRS